MLTISDCKTLKRHTLAAKAKSNAAGQASQQVQNKMVSPNITSSKGTGNVGKGLKHEDCKQ